MESPNASKIWLLRLVPQGRFGRWVSALGVFALMVAWQWSGGLGLPSQTGVYPWHLGLFFCVIVAYVTPVFHFITQRTEEALDELTPKLALDVAQVQRLRQGIRRKSWRWVLLNTALGTSLWLIQSFLLLGGSASMLVRLIDSYPSFVRSVTPLLVWLVMTCALHALVDNARMFRRLARRAEVDLLNTHELQPFGRMAVSSTLMVVGSQASFSIMWLGAQTDPWTTIPGLIATTLAMLFLFVAPVWPIHRALKLAKNIEYARVSERIGQQRDSKKEDYAALAPLLAYRREIHATAEWPFDLNLLTRLGLYLVIVPLTWIGAALIENLVDVFIA